MKPAWVLVAILSLVPMAFTGCSSDGGNGGDDGGLDAADAGDGQNGADVSDGADGGGDVGEDGGGDVVEPRPGKITVNASGITGHQNDGFLLMVSVTPAGDFQSILATACVALTSDPFSLPDTVVQGLEAGDPNPCAPSGGDKTFDPGDYDVMFVIIQAGQQMPEKSARVTVTVDGDVTASAPAFGEWRGPDPNKQPGTITVNASGITGHANDGFLLLVMATHPNLAWAGLAASCHMLTADPFSLPADATALQAIQPGDNGPCDASGGDMQFGGGDYDVVFVVIRGGEQVPEKTVTVPAVVDSDITVSAPDYGTWE